MPTASGVIAAVQEQRFRLSTDAGTSLLLTLAHDAPLDAAALKRLCESRARVEVDYVGSPGLVSGVAHNLRARDGAHSVRDGAMRPRLDEADRVGTSICPYCAVGCAQLVYARGNDIIAIEGDPSSPINQGTLCPKGAATFGWLRNPNRLTTVKYRAPRSDHWEDRPLDWAMERIAQLVKETRDQTFVRQLPDGTTVNHTLALAELGGATLDNEENYLIKKLCSGLGMVWVENQARI